jgi:hypothetical protein
MRRAARTRHPALESLRIVFKRAEVETRPPATVIPFPVPKRAPPPLAKSLVPVPPPRRRTLEQEELLLQEINGCKALLLEIVRRAAYDWVLYRASTRYQHTVMAEQAYHWLFLEVTDSPEGKERTKEGKQVTSFSGICELLGLDVGLVRGYIRKMTAKSVLNGGGPSEKRRPDMFISPSGDSYALPNGVAEYVPDDEVDDETVG